MVTELNLHSLRAAFAMIETGVWIQRVAHHVRTPDQLYQLQILPPPQWDPDCQL